MVMNRTSDARRPERTSEIVAIGLMNNMAGAAFKATEGQFVSLLNSASDGIPIHVSFYALPGLSPAESGGSHFASHYQSVETLMDTQLDGLIVTGREPKMTDLRDEPYWKSFTQVLDWARTNTASSIWSCLAAHAAVLHMDGIGRRRSADKNFGVFECARVSDHPLTHGLSPRIHVPHSRWNGIDESDLLSHDYSVLSRIEENGVDIFVKQQESLQIFFQGHLEYETDTLMREYRRDVGRYVKRETETYPLLPKGYFDRATEDALNELRDKGIAHRGTDLLSRVAKAIEAAKINNAWQSTATRIYRNWLEDICRRKKEDATKHQPAAVPSMAR
jgi:homoserine O-succinyltransferase/O-acetyltransferase